MASIIARFALSDGEYLTAIDGLFFNRRSSPTQPIHTAQWPCFALVVQGAKTLEVGSELYRYGVGDYLVVSIDVPVVSRVTEASAALPHLGLGMAIAPERLHAAPFVQQHGIPGLRRRHHRVALDWHRFGLPYAF